jgi:hypothetical protein
MRHAARSLLVMPPGPCTLIERSLACREPMKQMKPNGLFGEVFLPQPLHKLRCDPGLQVSRQGWGSIGFKPEG